MLVNHDELRKLLEDKGISKTEIENAENTEGSLGLEDLANQNIGECDYIETEEQFYIKLTAFTI